MRTGRQLEVVRHAIVRPVTRPLQAACTRSEVVPQPRRLAGSAFAPRAVPTLVVLAVVQGSLALVLVVAGLARIGDGSLGQPRRADVLYLRSLGPRSRRLVGIAELLGAVGLLLPGVVAELFREPRLHLLTCGAAASIAVLLGSAAAVHLRRRESPLPACTLAAAAAWVAVMALA